MCVVHKNYSLKKHNSFGLDVYSRYFIKLKDQQQVIDFIKSDLSNIRPLLIIGEGTNILFCKDYSGLIVNPKIEGIEKIKETSQYVNLRVGAG